MPHREMKGSPALTDQQRSALLPDGVSTILSAGAGTGKTRVLTERFLLHLAPGPRYFGVERMAALTFTDRAAREMRDRIRRRCSEQMLVCPAGEAEHWHSVLRDLERAYISTIHRFCARLLRVHAVEAGVDPRFEVLDEIEATVLQDQTVRRVLQDRIAQRDPDVLELGVHYRLSAVRQMLFTLLESLDQDVLDRLRSISVRRRVQDWHEQWRTVGATAIHASLIDDPRTRELLELLETHHCSGQKMSKRRRWLLENLRQPGSVEHLESFLKAVVDHARVQGSRSDDWPSRDVYERIKAGLEVFRESAKSWLVLYRDASESAEEAAQWSQRLLDGIEHVHAAYEQAKRQEARVDFHDLLVRTRDLLRSHPELRRRLFKQFQLILVDEFQDTDPLQVEILELLCGKERTRGWLFVVGDTKQSIYRFRRAAPHLFHKWQQETPPAGHKSLTENFRSQPAVLDFVNSLFDDALEGRYEPLRANASQTVPPPVVQFHWVVAEGDAQERRRAEARRLAGTLRWLIGEGAVVVRDPESRRQGRETLRPVRGGDIALLFRALSDVRFYEEALRECELDYYLIGGFAFYAQQEIFDIVNLLRVIENPDDAISLAGVLRSPFFSLRDETLFWLAGRRGRLAAGLCDAGALQQLSPAERERVTYAAGVLDRLREIKDRVPLAALIQQALEMTGYDAALLAEFLGERKLSNLGKLRRLARAFDQSGTLTLADFTEYLSEFVANPPREQEAAIHPEKSDVIRLMTIHQAKGLEFPVVVVPDLDRQEKDDRRYAILDPEIGPLLKLPSVHGERKRHLGMELYKLRERGPEEQEYRRLLYVACTRAADHVILSSSVEDIDRPQSGWMRLLARRFDLRSGRLQTPLPPDFPEPQIRVSLHEGSEAEAAPRAGARTRRPNWAKVVQQVEELRDQAPPVPESALPIAPSSSRPRKVSVTDINQAVHRLPAVHAGRESRVESPEPALDLRPWSLAPATSADAMLVGAVVHSVLERIDPARKAEKGAIDRLIEQCLGEYSPDFLTAASRVAASEGSQRGFAIAERARELIGRFLASALARELAAASEAHREIPFLLRWPPDGDGPVRCYLQGVIDCLFRDRHGRWHLVDYKTDDVSAEEVASRAPFYRLQLALYAIAAQRMAEQPLASTRLWFLQPGVDWTLGFSESIEPWVVEETNRAVEALSR